MLTVYIACSADRLCIFNLVVANLHGAFVVIYFYRDKPSTRRFLTSVNPLASVIHLATLVPSCMP